MQLVNGKKGAGRPNLYLYTTCKKLSYIFRLSQGAVNQYRVQNGWGLSFEQFKVPVDFIYTAGLGK